MLMKKDLLRMNDKEGSWSSNPDFGASGVKKLIPQAPFLHIKDHILQQQTENCE